MAETINDVGEFVCGKAVQECILSCIVSYNGGAVFA
jgi:hypothetical protein